MKLILILNVRMKQMIDELKFLEQMGISLLKFQPEKNFLVIIMIQHLVIYKKTHANKQIYQHDLPLKKLIQFFLIRLHKKRLSTWRSEHIFHHIESFLDEFYHLEKRHGITCLDRGFARSAYQNLIQDGDEINLIQQKDMSK